MLLKKVKNKMSNVFNSYYIVLHNMNKLGYPIRLLIEYRVNSLIKEFDIKIELFTIWRSVCDRNIVWEQLKQKLILHKFVTDDNDYLSCLAAIKNIIWKNIISYEARESIYYFHMIHSEYKSCMPFDGTPSLYIDSLLNRNPNKITNNNLAILQQKIINNLLLLHQIIVKYLIVDLLNITKRYIFDAWLVI